MVQICMFCLLGGTTITDLKDRRIKLWFIAFFAVIAVICYFTVNRMDVGNWIGGIMVGAAIIGISLITRGGIGAGDGFLLCVTGSYLGFVDNFCLLLTALCLASCFSAGLLILKKAGRKTAIPFVPFLLVSYIGVLIGQAIP